MLFGSFLLPVKIFPKKKQKTGCHAAPGLQVVRPAWVSSIGWKSRTGAGERLPSAEGKGVRREAESGGSRRQTLDPVHEPNSRLSQPVKSPHHDEVREVRSEGLEEKCQAVIKAATLLMNRSAKDGARSSPHHVIFWNMPRLFFCLG